MKSKIYKVIFLVLLSFFTACGSGESAATQDQVKPRNLTLNPNESIVCTSATSFTVIPSLSPNEPDVTFIQDVQSGDTTISVDIDSLGYISITECSKKL